MIPVLGITSTRWFCAEGCHKVQDDTITAYQHSAHSEISCMACHMPVAANPVIFLIHKAEALGELAQTVTDSYELPLNAESEVALTMTEDSARSATALDAQVHAVRRHQDRPQGARDKAVTCTLCHNRTAHVEDFALTLKNPKTGEPSTEARGLHEDDRVLPLPRSGAKAPAPGKCEACHTPGFKLRPPSHEATGAFVAKHAEIALEVDKEVKKTLARDQVEIVTGERKAEFELERRSQQEGVHEETVGELLPPVDAINECSTCHKDAFCLACHGTPMPHSAEFKEPKDAKDPEGPPRRLQGHA